MYNRHLFPFGGFGDCKRDDIGQDHAIFRGSRFAVLVQSGVRMSPLYGAFNRQTCWPQGRGNKPVRASLHDPGLLFTQGRVTAESAKN